MTRYRVGVSVPRQFTGTWPLAGLQFDEPGFEFHGPFLRYYIAKAVGLRHEWRDVAALRASRNGLTVHFVGGRRRVKITGLSRRRREALARAARSAGLDVQPVGEGRTTVRRTPRSCRRP